jgi:3-oxoacyl-[acyl-carrier protein] reductase
MAKKLKSRVLLITGASSGIGRELARHYAVRGFRVVGCSRSPAGFRLRGYEHFVADVADEAAVGAMFDAIGRRYGRLDALLNNAGIASMNHVLLTPMRTVREILETNVAGTFLVSREAAKLMRRGGGGRIVNFVSAAVPWKLEGEAAYVASKAAVLALTQVLARELADFAVTVNAVGPGPMDTRLTAGVPKAKLDALVRRQALRRPCRPADVANVVDFFLRPESGFVTGQVVFLGGP